MSHLELIRLLLLSVALFLDMVYTTYRGRYARQLAIKRVRTLSAKSALPPHLPEGL